MSIFVSIRFKILCVIVGMSSVLLAALFFVGNKLYDNYRTLYIKQCHALVEEGTTRVNNIMRYFRFNVQELALMGELLHQFDAEHMEKLGEYTVQRNIQINTPAVGGGIWYAPYSVQKDRELLCYYAHMKDGISVFAPGFASQDYHYPSQEWYRHAKPQLVVKGSNTQRGVVWSGPYVDEAGTHTLMSTVSTGMYASDGTFLGLATIDWSMDSIAKEIASVHPTPNSVALFADTVHGVILGFHDPQSQQNLVNAPLSTLPWFDANVPSERVLEYNGVRYLSFAQMMDSGMCMVINVPEGELLHDFYKGMLLTFATVLSAMLLTAASLWTLINRFVNRPVAHLCEAALQLGSGNLDADFSIKTHGELVILAKTFSDMTDKLKGHIADIATITADRERAATELDIAHEIQTSMLPAVFPPFPERHDCNLHAIMQSAKKVGGDFYDFFLLDDNRLVVVIADVSGKGVPAALFMAIAKTIIHNNALGCMDPGKVLSIANAQLCENSNTGMFVTAFIGVLDLESGDFCYANAGHHPFYILERHGAFRSIPLVPALPLAVMENTQFQSFHLTLEPGASLFFYTDGVTEASNLSGEFWGEGGLEEALIACAPRLPLDLSGFIGAIMDKLHDFTQKAPQSDDITMLAVAWTPDKDDTVSSNTDDAQGASLFRREQTFPARVLSLPGFMALLEEGLNAGPFTERQRMRFSVAAEEIFVNIASYAYEEDDNTAQVEVSLGLVGAPPSLHVCLIDHGCAFNPLESSDPDITLPADERVSGGLGIYLAGQGSSDMRYVRHEGKNILTMFLQAEGSEKTDTEEDTSATQRVSEVNVCPLPR